MVKPHEIEAAYLHNVRHHQIGGEIDGVSADVMADFGFETYEQTREIITGLGATGTSQAVPAPEVIKQQVARLAKPTEPTVLEKLIDRQRKRYGPK